MIHSMSGGVLSDGMMYTFAKVRFEDTIGWYLAPRGVKAGDRVIAPVRGESREGVVERLEVCSAQTAPVPLSRVLQIERVLS